jgi:hypothetical protein
MAVRVGQNIKQKSPVVLVTITDMRDGTAERVS